MTPGGRGMDPVPANTSGPRWFCRPRGDVETTRCGMVGLKGRLYPPPPPTAGRVLTPCRYRWSFARGRQPACGAQGAGAVNTMCTSSRDTTQTCNVAQRGPSRKYTERETRVQNMGELVKVCGTQRAGRVAAADYVISHFWGHNVPKIPECWSGTPSQPQARSFGLGRGGRGFLGNQFP